MKRKYKISFQGYVKYYHECEEYDISEYITNFGGIGVWRTIYTAKTKKECEEKLKEIKEKEKKGMI